MPCRHDLVCLFIYNICFDFFPFKVTQTDTREGQFDAKVYHLIFEDEFGRIKGHFGPINTLAIHPDGRSLATGSEDGFVRLNVFDDDYYDFEFEY